MTGTEIQTTLGTRFAETVQPRSERELGELVLEFARERRPLVPCGGGTKLGWGGPVRTGEVVLLNTSDLNRVADHDPANLTVSVQAGMPYGELQTLLRRHGQWLPLDSPWGGEATVGGIVASAASGPRRFGYGAPRDLVLGVRLALPDGSLVHFGGKTVKNVAGYDVTKLLVGSLGTLGVLTEVTFRLRPLPADERSLLLSFPNPDALDEAVAAVLRAPDPIVAVEATGRRGAGLLAEQGYSAGKGAYLLALRLEGTVPVLEKAVPHLLRALASEAERDQALVLGRDDSRAFWQDYEQTFFADWQEVGAVLRLRGPVREAVAALAALESITDAPGWVSAGTGVGFVKLEEPVPDLAGFVSNLRSALQPLRIQVDVLVAEPGGWASLEQAGIPAWAISESRLAKMREVKKIFDPDALLAPGRFGGGI